MPRSLAENKWKKYTRVCKFCWRHSISSSRSRSARVEREKAKRVSSKHLDGIRIKSIKILNERRGKKERKILLEAKTHINKELNRVEKLGKCEEKFLSFERKPLIYLFIFVPNVPTRLQQRKFSVYIFFHSKPSRKKTFFTKQHFFCCCFKFLSFVFFASPTSIWRKILWSRYLLCDSNVK